METVSLVARSACVYDGQPIKRGQKFLATAEDARLLTLIKLADPVEPKPVKEVSVAPLTDEADTPAPKRTYRRRDMTPEP